MLPSTAFLIGLFLGLAMGGFLVWLFLTLVITGRALGCPVEKPEQPVYPGNLQARDHHWTGRG